jgi:diguanylate cyclase (GGDEF)-like protein/PAS domain S-box-containing protein
VVVFQDAGSYLYVSNGTNGLRVETAQPIVLRSGDLVDVLGFPHVVSFRPVLENATVRRLGGVPAPKPQVRTARQLQEGDYDSALVSVQARLLEKSLLPRHQTLLLESGGLIFPASMDAGQPFAKLVSLPVGSVLRVTAICVLQRDKNGLNQSFQLLVGEPDDIAIISQPPWLNSSRALQSLGSMLLVVAVAFVWVVMLRRRVSRQTKVIRQEYEQKAVLQENYHNLFARHPHPMWVYDLETFRYLAVNEAAVLDYGYSAEEFLRMTILEIRPPEDVPRLMQDLTNTAAVQHAGIWKHRRKDGTLKDVEIASHELPFAGRPARLVVAVDVTERENGKQLGRDRAAAVEMIAKSCSLELTMRKLIEMVEHQAPQLVVSVARLDGSNLRYLASSLPAAILLATDAQPTQLNEEHASDEENDPFWNNLRNAALSAGFHSCSEVPVVSSNGSTLGALAVCRREAGDHSKGELGLISMAGQIASIAMEQRQLHDQLLFQAKHDPLTGLPNRLFLDDRLEQCVARSRRGGSSFAVLQIDLDRFKLVNDILGHTVGDTLLQAVAERLRGSIRQTDTLARVGGDEFTLLLTDLQSPSDARLVAHQLLKTLQEPFMALGNELFIGASIGSALYPQDAGDPCILLKRADAAMYRAKKTGKNRWHGFAPEMENVADRMELENHLRRALERDELEVFYQPLFHIGGSLVGMEALLRWRHPRLGLVPPGQFIPIAEETGLIVPIGNWVLKEACRQASEWQSPSGSPCRVAVNVSAIQLADHDFVQSVASALAETGLEPACLELEVTESVLMHDLETSGRQLSELRSLGVGIAVDDFGTGYSALSYLHRLPADYLKIDQSFVKEISGGTNSIRLVKAIVTMAHGLGIKVTAEGVETEQQLAVLRQLGCDQVQGFLLGRPMPLCEAALIAQGETALPLAG